MTTLRLIAAALMVVLACGLSANPEHHVETREDLELLPRDAERVWLRYARVWDSEDFLRFQAIRELCLTAGFISRPSEVSYFAALKNLRRLDIQLCSRAALEGLAALQTLESLSFNLSNVREMNGADIAVLAKLPKLNELSLAGMELSPKGAQGLAALKALRVLDISGVNVSREMLAALAGLEHLETLDLTGCKLESEWFSEIAKLNHLRELSLDCTQGVDDAAIARLKPLQKLESLRVFECDDITSKCMATIGALPALNSLSIPATSLTEDGGLAALRGNTRLKHLALGGCRLENSDFDTLATMTSLEELILRHTHGYESSSLLQLTTLRKLRLLDTTLAAASLTLVIETAANLPALMYLECYGLDHITGDTLKRLSGAANLVALDMGGRGLTNDSLTHLSSIPGLKYLRVGGEAVTDEGMKHLTACKGLVGVNVDECQITAAGLRQLLALPVLRWIGERVVPDDEYLAVIGSAPTIEQWSWYMDVYDLGEEPDLAPKPCHLNLGHPGATWTAKGFEALAANDNIVSIALGKAMTDDCFAPMAKMKGLRKLEVYDCDKITAAGLKQLRGLNSLRELWVHYNIDSGRDFFDAMTGLPGLASISMDGLGRVAPKDWMALANHKNLRNLTLFKPARLDAEAAVAFASLEKLESLSVYDCPEITADFIDTISLLPALKHFEVGRSNFPIGALKSFSRTKLTELTVWLEAENSAELIDIVSTFDSLKILQIGGPGPGTEINFAPLAKLKSLEELMLSFEGCTAKGLSTLASLDALVDLWLEIPAGDGFWKDIAALKQLRELHLDADFLPIPAAGAAPLKELKRLVELDLRYFGEEDDPALAAFEKLREALPNVAPFPPDS